MVILTYRILSDGYTDLQAPLMVILRYRLLSDGYTDLQAPPGG